MNWNVLGWTKWFAASTFFVTAAEIYVAVAAESFTAQQLALFEKCEKSPPAMQIRECTAAIDSNLFKDVQLAGLHANRANAYDLAGDSDSALKDYNRALELAPDSPGTYYNRGVLFVSRKDYESARKDYDAAIRLNPAFVPALFNRGRLFARQNDFVMHRRISRRQFG